MSLSFTAHHIRKRFGALARPASIFFPAMYLFVLPYAHVTALRSLGFAGTLVILAFALARRAHPPLPLKAPFAFWLVAALASIATTVDMRMTLGEIRSDVVYSIFTFYAFFVLTRDVSEFRRWRNVAAASMALIGTIAVASYLRRGTWGYGYQNFLGEYSTAVVTSIPLLLTAFVDPQLRVSKRAGAFYAAAIAVALWGGLLARSRAFWVVSGLIALVTSAFYALQDWPRRRWAIMAAVALVALAGAAGAFVSAERGIKFDKFSTRAPIYAFVTHNIVQHPLYGTGFGRETNRAAYRRAFPDMGILHAHDLLFSYTEQMGVWGTIAVLWLFGALALPCWRAWRSSRRGLAAAGAGGLTLLAAVFVKNTTDMFFTGQLLLLFWAHAGIFLGLIARYGRDGASADLAREAA